MRESGGGSQVAMCSSFDPPKPTRMLLLLPNNIPDINVYIDILNVWLRFWIFKESKY